MSLCENRQTKRPHTSVIQQVWSSYVGVNGRVHDDGTSWLHVGDYSLCEVEIGMDVDVERIHPLFGVQSQNVVVF